MLTLRHFPGLVTPALWDYLRPLVSYDAGGRCSRLLKGENDPLPPALAAVARGVCGHASFREVALQAYRDGAAVTPCHTDRGVTGFSFVLSLGAPRTFLVHRVTDPCGGPGGVSLECTEGTAVLMEEAFHLGWHHRLAPDPHVTSERLGLVFRTAPSARTP